VREITRAMLRELSYRVLDAGSGGAALDMLDREAQIDLIVVDFAMPGMNGAGVARQALARRPGLPVLFVTGFADRSAMAGVSDARVISKPFVDDELAIGPPGSSLTFIHPAFMKEWPTTTIVVGIHSDEARP
jgi:CheY-like chemotaxis protein